MTQEFNFTESVDGSYSSTTFFDDTLDGGVASSTSFTVTLDGGKSNVNRIKNKISSIVYKQLPEFIPEEYPTFVAFLEAYYRFLEQNRSAAEILQNSSSYLDIDRTTPEFVKYLLLNYTKDFPITTLANKPFLIKKIKDLYESKGSELSFKLLFRLIYQTDVEVSYPYENVLIPSNGVWTKRASIRVQRVFGDLNSLVNRLLVYTSPSGVISYTKILDYKVVTGDYVEIYLDINTLAQSYSYGRDVFVYSIDPTTTRPTDNDIAFKGVVSPYVTDYTILKGGAGFKVNTVFELVYKGGVGTLVKISKVSSTGAIEGLEFIRYGTEYPTDEIEFIINLDPENVAVTTLPADIFSSSTYGFTDSGQIVKTGASYIPLYFAEDYTSSVDYLGEVIRTFAQSQFNSNTISAGQIEPRDEIAIINFTQSDPLITYPGYYTDSKGFLSESDIVLQDGEVHQAFAYRTTTSLDVSLFYDVVKSLIHPAGLQLFNNFLVDTTLDISNNISSTSVTRANVIFEAHDSAAISDFSQVGYGKVIQTGDTTVEPVSDISAKNIIKVLVDGIDTSEFTFYNFTKFIVDQAEVVDPQFFTLQTTFSDNTITADEDVLSVGLNYQDSVDGLDQLQTIEFKPLYEDNVDTTEQHILNVNVVTNDEITTEDSVFTITFFNNVPENDSLASAVDQTSVSVDTEFSDNTNVVDNSIILANPVLDDVIDTLDDTLNLLTKVVDDIQPSTDELSQSLSRTLEDASDALDNTSINYQTQFSDDTSGFIDNSALTINPVPSDDLSTFDVISIGKFFGRDVFDNVEAESFYTASFQTSFEDILSNISDNNIISANLINDENLETIDAVNIAASLIIEDLASTKDEVINSVSSVISDVNNTVDSGLLERRIINTDYATDYFAETYIDQLQETRNL